MRVGHVQEHVDLRATGGDTGRLVDKVVRRLGQVVDWGDLAQATGPLHAGAAAEDDQEHRARAADARVPEDQEFGEEGREEGRVDGVIDARGRDRRGARRVGVNGGSVDGGGGVSAAGDARGGGGRQLNPPRVCRHEHRDVRDDGE